MDTVEDPPTQPKTGEDPPQHVEGQDTSATSAASTNFLCDICGKHVPKAYYRRHQLRHRPKLPCERCSKSFHDRFALKNHTDFQHNQKVVVCEVCGKICKSYSSFMQHRYSHQSKKQSCKTCKQEFSSKSELYRHRRKAHLPHKTCDTCGKSFGKKCHLTDHLKTHQGAQAKEHKCTIGTCNASFKQKQSLKRHMSTHEELKTCNLCDKTYKGSRQLMRHIATVHNISME